jgi:hypothetical protein
MMEKELERKRIRGNIGGLKVGKCAWGREIVARVKSERRQIGEGGLANIAH